MSFARLVTQPLRALSRRPGFSAVVVLTLTLGIGITTAVFSIFNGVLLTPPPYPQPEQLVVVYDTQPACSTCPASYPKYRDWAERNTVFQKIGGATPASFVLTGPGDPQRVGAARATASFFEVFSVPPRIGRFFTADEDQPGGPKVAVITHPFWMNQFQGSSNAIGQKLILDGEPHEVVGVMPEGFVYGRTEVLVPLQAKLDPSTRGSHFLPVFARLKSGVEFGTARREMQSLGETLAKEFGHNHGIDLNLYTEALVGRMRTPLNVLLGAVLLLLLIGAANVANLMLAAGLARRRELAIRMSLGAGIRQLAQMVMVEGFWLAALGGLFGVLLSRWLVSVFVVLAGNQLPRSADIHLDSRVLMFSALLSAGVGLLCSLFPVALLRRSDLSAGMREGDARAGSQSGNKTRRALVVTEIALAFCLLVSSALLIKNLMLLRSRDAGIRSDRIASFNIALSGTRYRNDSDVRAFYRELYERMSHVDGVEKAGLVSHLPMVDFGYNGEFAIEGDAPWRANEAPLVEYRWIYGNYLQVMGIPLLNGRLLDARDGAGTRTVLVNKAMAEKFWPGQNPIGKRFGQGRDRSTWFEVVGVIGNVRSYGLARSHPFEFFRTIDQSTFGSMTMVLETRAEDPLTAIPLARQVVQSLDPTLPITRIQTMEKAMAESLGTPRLMSALTGLFGGLAGLLAMVGVYSVMAYNVNRQRREFGIRLALGADRTAVARLVLKQGLLLTALGIVIGAVAAGALTRVLIALLNDVKPTDPAVFVVTAAGVAAVALAACYLPARSAGRVNPMDVLRAD